MDALIQNFYVAFDNCIMFFYRLTGIAIVDYMIGTLILSLLAVVVGEITVSLAVRVNRSYTDRMGEEAERMERLSIAAYEAGDKAGYRALNKEATDAWGKQFFTMAAYSAGILWPIPFVLHWMQWRFGDVTFPIAFPFSMVFTDGVGYLFTFFPIYILARILFKRIRRYLPYFRGVQKMLDEAHRRSAAPRYDSPPQTEPLSPQPVPAVGRPENALRS
jgi:hypothetical protein